MNNQTRLEILHIATAKWTPKPTEEFLEVLSDKTVGFCGADLKAICAEAALRSLRRRYPQIYDSSDRYQLDFDSIVISETDFDSAMANFASATSRSSNTSVQKIPTHLSSLLHDHFNRLVQLMPLVESCKRFVSGRRIILCANGSFHGQTSHLAPALLYSFDSQPIINLAIPELFQGVHRTPEEVVAELLTKARKSSPCVIYLPIIESWLTAVPASVWATFKSGLSTITPSVPITIVATSHNSYEDLDMEIASMFDPTTEVFQVSTPSGAERHAFFTNLFKEVERLKPPVEPKINQLEKLVILPPPPPKKISPERLRLMEEEEKEIFADLRIFLREMLHKLIIDKKFHIFAEPVDYNDVSRDNDNHTWDETN